MSNGSNSTSQNPPNNSQKSSNEEQKYIWANVLYNNTLHLFKYSRTYNLKRNQHIIVTTQYGQELARVLGHPIPYPKSNIKDVLYEIVRLANDRDLNIYLANQKKIPNSFKIAQEKINNHKLPIRLISVHHFLDGKKVLFHFYAESRVDFRSLVKDLANTFKARIELRQIGIRDVSSILSGYGICGREFCCYKMRTHKESISIKQVKQSNTNLSSYKITGSCGRLMCCLNYEKDMDEDEIKNSALKIGANTELSNDANYDSLEDKSDTDLLKLL